MQTVDIKAKPLVYTNTSKIKEAGDGLFAKKQISKGTSVVIYHGNKITDEEICNLYEENKETYFNINPYMRGTPNGYAVIGNKESDNANLLGVYVNDFSAILCDKNQVDEKVLKDYAKTLEQCNVKTFDTEEYPYYVSTKRIKKGEELYVHYGIGHWLSHIGCTPYEISELNEKYKFNSYY